jgi:hypothetical protein
MAWTYRIDIPNVWAHCTQAVIAQKDRDDSINELAKIMGETYALLQEVDPLKKVKSHESTIISLMKKTIECAYFIRDYAEIKNFCMLVPILSGGSSLC